MKYDYISKRGLRRCSSTVSGNAKAFKRRRVTDIDSRAFPYINIIQNALAGIRGNDKSMIKAFISARHRLIFAVSLIIHTATVSATETGETEDFESDGITYRILSSNDLTVAAIGANGQSDSIFIPEKISYNNTEYVVTEIGSGSLFQFRNVVYIKLPSTITRINDNTFYGGTLSNIALNDGITYIGYSAFYSSNLTKIEIPESIEYIGSFAFCGCSELTKAKLPSTLTNIPDYMFGRCERLTDMTIPSSVTSIGDHAFYNTALNNIVIPESVTSIASGAFSECDNLFDVTFPKHLTEISGNPVANCQNLTAIHVEEGNPAYIDIDGVLYTHDVSEIIAYPGGKNQEHFSIPESVKKIDNMAFAHCKNLTSIEIPSSVISIGNGSFSYCSNLTDVNIPAAVTQICSGAFEGCGIETLSIPESVTTIEERAFGGCKIKILELPESVTNLGNDVFNGCAELTTAVLPSSLTYVPNGIFGNCSKLTEVILPVAPESIGEYAFGYCTSLTETLIPNTVTSIARRAFEGCSSLTEISLPASINSVGEKAFAYCNRLASIYSHNPNAIKFYNESAETDYSNTILYVPAGSAELYKSSDAAYIFKDIEEIDFDAIEALNVSYESIGLFKGSKVELKIPGFETILEQNATWRSDNDAVATVDADGKVSAVGAGRTNVTCDIYGIRFKCGVTVSDAEPALTGLIGIGLPKSEVSIDSSNPFIIDYDMLFADSQNIPEYNIEYFSSNDAVVTIDTDGTIHPHKNGNIIIKIRITPFLSRSSAHRSISINPGGFIELNVNVSINIPGLSEIDVINMDSRVIPEYYKLNGQYAGNHIASLTPGIYIMRQGNKISKILVK